MGVSSVEINFSQCMKEGQACLERRVPGRNDDVNVANAIQWFKKARTLAASDQEVLQSEQSLGIAHRLRGNYGLSRDHFKLADMMADKLGLLMKSGSIKRDLSIAELEDGNLSLAETYINQAEAIHRAWYNELLSDSSGGATIQEAACELAATISFRARIAAEKGQKDEARRLFRKADNHLRGNHDQYERNNLRHWLLIEFSLARLFRFLRLEILIRTGRSDGK